MTEKTFEDKVAEARAMDIGDFVKLCIRKLRVKDKSLGIHTVYSGLNQAIRDVYELDPVEAIKGLVETDKFGLRPVKGGAMVFLPEDASKMAQRAQENATNKLINTIIG